MTAPDVPWLAVALLALSILALLHRPLAVFSVWLPARR